MEMRTVGCLGSPMWKPYIATRLLDQNKAILGIGTRNIGRSLITFGVQN